MLRNRAGAALAVVAAALLAPSAAPAATTIGSTASSTTTATGSGPATYLQTQSPTVGPGYTVPAGTWVLTSFSARVASDGADPAAAGVVARPSTTPGDFEIRRLVPLEVDGNQSLAVETSTPSSAVPVSGGDRIGIAFDDDVLVGYTNPASGALLQMVDSFVSEATTQSFGDDAPSSALAVSATLEPDADGDGAGDETQDACPNDASRTISPCASTPPPGGGPPQTQTPTTAPAPTPVGTAIAPVTTGPKRVCKLSKAARGKLVKTTLSAARTAIRTAGCKVGKVKRPKKVRKGRVLRVSGVTVTGDTAAITLGSYLKAKPKKTRRR